MSWLFLVAAIIGCWFTVNAFRPVRRNRVLFGPSFFAAWMTTELAGHHIFWQAVATVVFIALGALETWVGWLALALVVAQWIGLVVLMAQGFRAAQQLNEAMGDLLPGEPAPPVPWSRVVLPFRMHRKGVRRDRNIEFARAGGRVLKLDVFRSDHGAAAEGERRPAILQIHGGGWVIGDKREQGIPLLEHLAANGWVGFNANYRLSPFATWPEHLIDLKRAIAWIREHADEYGIDPGFVAVTGGSAGGHLAALMALTAGDPEYQPGFEDADTSFQAAVPFYAVYDFTDRLGVGYPGMIEDFLEPWVMKAFLAEEPEKFASASPIDQVRQDAPPFLVLHGDKDTLAPVENARLFVERLRAVSDAPVVYAELKGAHHAFDLFVSARAKPVIEAVERFLCAALDRARGVEGIPEADLVDAAGGDGEDAEDTEVEVVSGTT
jgi:acetyl esterase/lipase